MDRVGALRSTLRRQDQVHPEVTPAPRGHWMLIASRIATVALVAGFALWPAPARASLTVTPGLTVSNRCPQDIIIAVRYKDSRGSWTTTSFNAIRARGQKDRVASSDNSIFYYYAESTTGSPTRWAGDREVKVEGKAYQMKEKKLTLDRERNRYLLELTCTK